MIEYGRGKKMRNKIHPHNECNICRNLIINKGSERMKAKEDIKSEILDSKPTLQDMLDSFKNTAQISYCGLSQDKQREVLIISWSETGRGFGEYTFVRNLPDGKWELDNEDDSLESVKRIMCSLVDSTPIRE